VILACAKSVETSPTSKQSMLGNQKVRTDRTIPNNKTDVIIRDNEKGTCTLISIALSGDRNVIKIETESILNTRVNTLQ
jgi:hypothetical protein